MGLDQTATEGHGHDHDTDLTGVTADDHHSEAHAHDGVDESGTVAHGDTTGQTVDDHHNENHAARHGDGGADEVTTASSDHDTHDHTTALGTAAIADLSDVSGNAPSAGDAFVWDDGAGLWVPTDVATQAELDAHDHTDAELGHPHALGDLSNVTATGEGSGGGFDADTVDGQHASELADSGHDHDGAYLQDAETVVFTADGTFSKADHPGLKFVRVRIQAAGGGGGGADDSASGQASGGSGGAGGFAEAIIAAASLSASETVTVGAGGDGGTATNAGSAGGSSAFGAHCSATGGGGGDGMAGKSGNGGAVGGDGGSGSGGDINLPGGDGNNGRVAGGVYVNQGLSGASVFGGARRQGVSTENGRSGAAPGAGGAGAIATSTQRTGGAGADGVVIVEVFT